MILLNLNIIDLDKFNKLKRGDHSELCNGLHEDIKPTLMKST